MNRLKFLFSLAAIICCSLFLCCNQTTAQEKKPKKKAFINLENVDDDFQYQGEYEGTLDAPDGPMTMGVQIVAQGNGKFKMKMFIGGFPDEDNQPDIFSVPDIGELKDGVVVFSNENGTAKIQNDEIAMSSADDQPVGSLKKVKRKSKTLGEKPPAGAVVLFDGSSADQWEKGKMTDDGLLMQGTTSKAKFGDQKIHIEFLLPYMPESQGQARGNSGIYIQGRYEIQMLDSFGLEGKMNECGGIYSVRDCDKNMCYPPLSWQTFDIEFTAAKFEGEGDEQKIISAPRMTVYHNGVKIHDDVELPADRGTTASPIKPGADAGPLYLQNHGCPVRYRNIWVEEK